MIFESKVAVANVWTAPQSPREIDQKVLHGSFKIKEWIDKQTYEEKLALCEENLIQSQVLLGERVIGLEEADGLDESRYSAAAEAGNIHKAILAIYLRTN